jgi:hypothetical protein
LELEASLWKGLRWLCQSRIAAFAVNRNAVQRMAFRTISQTGIRYPQSFLSKSLEGLQETAPQAGDRFPWLRLKFAANGPGEDLFQKLSEMHFNLILIGRPHFPESPPNIGDLLCVHVISADAANDEELARVRIPQPSFYLVRPDGDIGLCGTRLKAGGVRDYLSQNLHLSTPGAVPAAAGGSRAA